MHACLGLPVPTEARPLLRARGRDFLVYLAGPIAGLTYTEGQTWRDYVAATVPEEIRTISPLRGKSVRLARVGKIENSYEDNPLTAITGITTRDRFDCTRADAVLFNCLDMRGISIGTMIELGWADAARNPIILVAKSNSEVAQHPMVRGIAGYILESLDDALMVLEAVLLPEGMGTAREQ
jgi:hypothetical protein